MGQFKPGNKIGKGRRPGSRNGLKGMAKFLDDFAKMGMGRLMQKFDHMPTREQIRVMELVVPHSVPKPDNGKTEIQVHRLPGEDVTDALVRFLEVAVPKTTIEIKQHETTNNKASAGQDTKDARQRTAEPFGGVEEWESNPGGRNELGSGAD